MLEVRVGNMSLDESYTRHGRMATVGETGWMVAWKVPHEWQQGDSVRRLIRETVPRRDDEVRGGSSVPCDRFSQWKDSGRNQTGSEQTRDLSVEYGLAAPRNPMNISLRRTQECTPATT